MTNILLICLIVVVGALTLILSCAQRLFYYPNHKVYDNPADYGLQYEDVYFVSQDGTKLHGWFILAQNARASYNQASGNQKSGNQALCCQKPGNQSPHKQLPEKQTTGTVVHFHGNAQNMTSHFNFVRWLPENGFNVFVFDYRGYGKSAGKVSKKGIYQDSVAALKYVHSRNDVDGNRIVVLGQSLGGNNAIAAAADFNWVKAIAAESTFFSYRSIVSEKFGLIPLLSWFREPLSKLAVNDDYSAANYVKNIKCPIVFIHGKQDRLISYKNSERLFNLASQPKELWLLESGKHIEAFSKYGDIYRRKLLNFYKKALVQK